MMSESIQIGKYELIKYDDMPGIFIEITADGEGGQFNEIELEAIIDKFYKDNF